MPTPSNYPPGVTGNEPQITGGDDDYETAVEKYVEDAIRAITLGLGDSLRLAVKAGECDYTDECIKDVVEHCRDHWTHRWATL